MMKIRFIVGFSLLSSTLLLYFWMNRFTNLHRAIFFQFSRPKYKMLCVIRHNVTNGHSNSGDVIIKDNCTLEENDLMKELSGLCDLRLKLPNNCSITMKDNQLSFLEYKKQKAKEFTKEFANPFKKSSPPPKLPMFRDTRTQNTIKNPSESIDADEIRKQLEGEKKRRINLGDRNLTTIPEVTKELSTGRVPNIIHFIYFGCLKVRVFEYITFIGALRFQKPELILFHTNCEPQGEYWKAFKQIAGKKLLVVARSPPESVWGRSVKVVEHKADVARLEILLEIGGIYLDTDSVILTSLDELMDHDLVLGEESEMDLANGVILAKRDAWFLKRWFWEYRYFQDSNWGESSVIAPWGLWKLFPDKIFVVKQKICRPNWKELNLLFHELIDWKNHYIMHLYSRFMKSYDGKKERPIKELAVLNTTYGAVARHALWGDDRIRDVTEWIVTCNMTERLISEYNASAPPSG